MKACPNCGRPTARTKDWACQWCGYPLLSGGYKALPETYSELKGKIKPEGKPPVPELLESEVIEPKAETVVELEAKTEVEPEPEAEPEPVLGAKPKPKSKAKVKTVAEPEPEVEAAAEPEPVLEAEDKREPEPELESEPVAEAEPEPGAPLSVDFLYSRLQADREATDAKYMNQVLKVTGLVYRTIINENLTVAYVILAGTKRYGEQQVTCAFDTKHTNEIRQLNGRDPVTVQGTYDGYAATVLMRDCELVEG
jgi:hypothetical protein